MPGGWGTNHVRGQGGYTAFVPDGDSRRETAVLLVGTAREYGIDQRSIRAARGGFYISDELADRLDQEYEEPTFEEPVSEPEAPSPVSGNDADEADDEESGDIFDPADYTIPQIKEFVTEHPDLASDVLASEEAGENRATLIKWLAEFSDDETSGNRAAKNSTTEKE